MHTFYTESGNALSGKSVGLTQKSNLIALVLIALFSAWRAGAPKETDPYWQIREGREFLDHGTLVHADTWSWAPVDHLVSPNSPGWNAVLATVFDGAGWWGFFLLSFLSIAFALWLVTKLAAAVGAKPIHIALMLVLVFATTLPVLSARGALVAYSLLMAAILIGRQIAVQRLETNIALTTTVGFLFAFIGNWIHTSWGLFTPIMLMIWGALWLNRNPKTWWAWIAATGGAALGIATGPYGFGVYSVSAEVSAIARGLLIEWASPWVIPDRWYWGPISALLLLTALYAARQLFKERRDLSADQFRLEAVLVGTALAFIIAGLFMSRFLMAAMFFLGPVLAGRLSNLHYQLIEAPGTSQWRKSAAERLGERYLSIVLTGVSVLLLVPAVPAMANLGKPVLYHAALELPSGCNLFASDSGAVLLMRPDIKVWIDGRADYWGPARLQKTLRYFKGTMPQTVPPGTSCVLIANAPLFESFVRRMSADPTFVELEQSEEARIWVRTIR